MAIFRAQIVLQGFTNLPSDRYTNTMHFVYDGAELGDIAPALSSDLEAFYDVFGSSIAAYVSRTVTCNIYDLSQAPPRVPATFTWTIPTASDAAPSLPSECAFVLGYRAALPHTASRRNRIYLGPMSETLVQAGSTTSFPFVSVATRNVFLGAASTLYVQSTSAPLSGEGWVIYSPTRGETYPIAQFYMDGEVDTQRRRGYRTTDRTIIAAP
jgi:hypothetical protein